MTLRGTLIVKSIRPDHQEPLAGSARANGQPPGIGKLAFRFVFLLAIAIAFLLFAWHR